MRYLVAITLILTLLLSACGGGEVTGKVLDAPADSGSAAPAAESNVPSTPKPVERKAPEQFSDVTEAPTYEAASGTCNKDSLGVVRHFDDDGKKTVYRAECLAGILITYDCVDNKVTSDNRQCFGECKRGVYGDTCA